MPVVPGSEGVVEDEDVVTYNPEDNEWQLYFAGGDKRFLSKNPLFTNKLGVLRRTFPDARFVFIHRDPVKTFSSICSLHAYTRAVFSSEVDARRLGQPQVAALANGLAAQLAAVHPQRVVGQVGGNQARRYDDRD